MLKYRQKYIDDFEEIWNKTAVAHVELLSQHLSRCTEDKSTTPSWTADQETKIQIHYTPKNW
jgi:hypothetical protein